MQSVIPRYLQQCSHIDSPMILSFSHTAHLSKTISLANIDWCGPCKALAPALEQMAVKAGGMFRLVKLNSDNERSASQALEVKALPTGEIYSA